MCADSAKVRLNNGILQRRYQAWDRAMEHFVRAQEIEPGYCEPDYWIGATLVRPPAGRRQFRGGGARSLAASRAADSQLVWIPQTNMNQIREGLDRLEKALDCKYVAVEAATAIGVVRAEPPRVPCACFAARAVLRQLSWRRPLRGVPSADHQGAPRGGAFGAGGARPPRAAAAEDGEAGGGVRGVPDGGGAPVGGREEEGGEGAPPQLHHAGARAYLLASSFAIRAQCQPAEDPSDANLWDGRANAQDASRCKTLIDAFEERMEALKRESPRPKGGADQPPEMTSPAKAAAVRDFIRVRGYLRT